MKQLKTKKTIIQRALKKYRKENPKKALILCQNNKKIYKEKSVLNPFQNLSKFVFFTN